jgi:DsbC/DsbD-like thiol-disulfide interchange protein
MPQADRKSGRLRNRIVAFIALLCCGTALFNLTAPSSAEASDPQGQPVTVRLKVESDEVGSGAVIYPAVHFSIPKPWHIYWKNPGDAGLPTKVEFKLPPGFSAGELIWPPHKTFTQPGGLVGYGYEETVALSAPVQIPAGLPDGEKFEITAEVRWLACYDRCIPGRAKLTRELTISSAH